MVIYIEYVLLDNTVMNYLIFNFIELTNKIKLRKLNKCLSCFCGSLLTVFLPYIYKYSFLLFAYRIFISLLMLIVLKKYKNIKEFFTYYILFIAYTFMLGGIIFGVISMFKIDYTISGILFYTFEFPVGIFITLGMFGIFLGKKILIFLKGQLRLGNLLYNIKLFSNNSVVNCVGFYDSGNRINVDGEFVSIITIDVFLKLYTNLSLDKIILKKLDSSDLKNMKYISICGLKNNGKYLSFILDKMQIENKEYKDVRVAVSLKSFNKFDCILSSVYEV